MDEFILFIPIAIIFFIVFIAVISNLNNKVKILNSKVDYLNRKLNLFSNNQHPIDKPLKKTATTAVPQSNHEKPVVKPKEKPLERPLSASTPKPLTSTAAFDTTVSQFKITKKVEVAKPLIDTSKSITEPAQKAKISSTAKPTHKRKISFEELLGIRGALIAGIFAILFAAIYFVKYSYDNNLVGPEQRIIAITIWGFITIATGEFTRKKGYNITAKGVAVLGFCMLFAANFMAFKLYALISPTCTYSLATVIVFCSIAYALYVDEQLIAILALLCGFATPIIVNVDPSFSHYVFAFMAILSLGTCLGIFSKKWHWANGIAFLGCFFYYAFWFLNNYINWFDKISPELRFTAVLWLAIFGSFFYIWPILKRYIKGKEQNIWSILVLIGNALFVTIFLLSIYEDNFNLLALLSLVQAIFFLASYFCFKTKNDDVFSATLLVLSTFFVTIACAYFFEMTDLIVVWSIEAFFLAYLGTKFRIKTLQVIPAILIYLNFAILFSHWPTHDGSFVFIFNREFIAALALPALLLVGYQIIYRKLFADKSESQVVAKLSFSLGTVLLLALLLSEWHSCLEYTGWSEISWVVIPAIVLPLWITKYISPRGTLATISAYILYMIAGCIITLQYSDVRADNVSLFLNPTFGFVAFFIASFMLFIYILKKNTESKELVPVAVLFSTLMVGIFVSLDVCLQNTEITRAIAYTTLVWATIAFIISLLKIDPYKKYGLIIGNCLTIISVFVFLFAWPELRQSSSLLFSNLFFGIGVAMIASLALQQYFRNKKLSTNSSFICFINVLITIFLLIIVTQEIYLYFENNAFKAIAYITSAWAAIAFIISLLKIEPYKKHGVVIGNWLTTISILVFLVAWPELRQSSSLLFSNLYFGIGVAMIVSLFLQQYFRDRTLAMNAAFIHFIHILVSFFFLIIITQEIYWNFESNKFLAQMYIDIAWAIYALALMALGIFKDKKSLRYMSLTLLIILLGKVFLFDTIKIKSVYRIAAFLVTGMVLVGVSYLYQILTKKGILNIGEKND